MRFFSLTLTVFAALNWSLCLAWPSSFSTDGFKQVTSFSLKKCDAGFGKALSQALGKTDDMTKVVDYDTKAVTCDSNTLSVKLTLKKNDTDKYKSDRQRIELKAGDEFNDTIAKSGQSFVYRWWFYLPSNITVASKRFFHNFQIKAVGKDVERQPMATFSLDNGKGYYLRLCPVATDDCSPEVYKPLVALSQATGKWIQAYVKVSFASPVVITAILADENGKTLATVKDVKLNRDLGTKQYRPKMGLYREKDASYRPVEYGLFKNIEIWRK